MTDNRFVLELGPPPVAEREVKRRDFLYIVTAAMAAVGGAFVAWPFVDQMEPSSDVIAAGEPVEKAQTTRSSCCVFWEFGEMPVTNSADGAFGASWGIDALDVALRSLSEPPNITAELAIVLLTVGSVLESIP